jgi:glucoamylase
MAGLVVQMQDYLPSPANASGLLSPTMHALSSLLLLGTCAVQSVLGRPDAALRAKREAAIVKRAVDNFIETERPIAWNKLLCNIGPDGCAASGVGPGVVIASPSKSEPDCKWQPAHS